MTAKKKCCKDKPRCKKCPVVLMRLDAKGYAEREGKRDYRTFKNIPRKILQAARAR